MPTLNEIEAICQRARECVRKRQFADAVGIYEQALALDERDIRVHEGIATAAFLAGDFDRAEKHFKRLSQLDLKRADPLVNLGAVYNRRSDFNNAVKTLRQALTKNRKCAEAYYNLGIAYKGLNQLSMAVSAYKEAIRLAPEMAEGYQNLGNVFVEMGNLQQAITNFRRALEIKPDFERAKRGLEAAHQQALENAKETKPFGRLVNVEQLKGHAQVAAAAAGLRELTEDERKQDRAIVHKLAVAFEQRAEDVKQQARESLGPALLAMFHAVAQADDKRRLFLAHEALVAALDQYRQATGPLLRGADELQLHEEQLQRSLRTA